MIERETTEALVGYGRAAFYVYAYPEPPGYGDARLRTAEAFYDRDLGQFILPYDAVREPRNPDALLLGFLQVPTRPLPTWRSGTGGRWNARGDHVSAGRLSESKMISKVQTWTPPNTPTPIGPYSHVAKVGQHIAIGGTAGFNPATGELAGPDVQAQTRQILQSFKVMLASVGSDLDHVVHINIFLKDMRDFELMNAAYVEAMGGHRPARTVIGVQELPKPGILLR